MIIDAHQHFWKFDPVRDSWINDDMQAIRKDFLPPGLEVIFNRLGIAGSVAVQADQSEAENDFLLNLAEQFDFIKGVVGWVDLQSESLHERLAYYKQFPKIKGFRHVLQGENDRALMLKPAFRRGIKMLQDFDFSYDILIFPDQLTYCYELVAAYPEQRFVIDHLAKPDIKQARFQFWEQEIRKTAKHKNLLCKISGMVTEADWNNWRKEDFARYMDVVVDAFGMSRLMYGSDFPVCLVAASYEQVFEIVKYYFSAFSAAEREQFFALNATQFYNLNK